jgi:hypothetical protein
MSGDGEAICRSKTQVLHHGTITPFKGAAIGSNEDGAARKNWAGLEKTQGR